MIEIRNYTDAELLALPPLVIEPGTTDANGVTRNKVLRNPFAPDGKPVDDEPRRTLAGRWSTLHWNKPADESETAVVSDPFDLLRDAIAAMDGTPLFFSLPECDGMAAHPLGVNPRNPVAVAAWESTCQAMHDSQRAIVPEEKPKPVRFEDHVRSLRRSD